MVAITSLRKDVIFAAVRGMYTDVARHPERTYHVPTGREACAFVGYPNDRLTGLPASAIESFAGVGYPFAARVIRPGDTILDVGSGSGTDLLIAAQETGERGHLIGLDMTAAMVEKGNNNLAAAKAMTVRVLEGNAEKIPLPDGSVDVVTSNGVFNLVPDKAAAFAEIHRVLRPGGRVQIADIAVGRPLSGECASDPKLWAECIVGATLTDEYHAMIEHAGFVHVEALGQLDYFSASTSAATRSIAESFRACSFVLRAAKPPSAPLPAPLAWPPISSAARIHGDGGRTAQRPVEPAADTVLDVYGQACGTVEPMMKLRMRSLESGQVLEVRVDDPAARLGVPAWSRLTGHALLATIEDDERRTRFFLRKR
jgi:ubiquinone/menaquinone biosynthesis C-methylase UbiE/TusA-related sulfurtransferase